MKITETILPSMVNHLLKLSKVILELDQLPEIVLLDKPLDGTTSFGVFDGSIKVVYKDRHPLDTMRTLAHELVHYKQSVLGQELDGTTGSNTENQANAIAGVIMREFGKKYPSYFLDLIPQ